MPYKCHRIWVSLFSPGDIAGHFSGLLDNTIDKQSLEQQQHGGASWIRLKDHQSQCFHAGKVWKRCLLFFFFLICRQRGDGKHLDSDSAIVDGKNGEELKKQHNP